jgi:hypothetical protein
MNLESGLELVLEVLANYRRSKLAMREMLAEDLVKNEVLESQPMILALVGSLMGQGCSNRMVRGNLPRSSKTSLGQG